MQREEWEEGGKEEEREGGRERRRERMKEREHTRTNKYQLEKDLVFIYFGPFFFFQIKKGKLLLFESESKIERI